MRKFQCLLLVLRGTYICYYINFMSVLLITDDYIIKHLLQCSMGLLLSKFQFVMNLFHSNRSGSYDLTELCFHIIVLKGLVNSVLNLQFKIKNYSSYFGY